MIDELDHFVVKNLILAIILPTFVPVKNQAMSIKGIYTIIILVVVVIRMHPEGWY